MLLLCVCLTLLQTGTLRWTVLIADKNHRKINSEFLLSSKFPRGQDLVRTGNEYQVFLTPGQPCQPSLWCPFHRIEAKESPSISRVLKMFKPLCKELFLPESLYLAAEQAYSTAGVYLLLNMRSNGRCCESQNYFTAVNFPHCLYQVLKNTLRC